MVSLLSLGIKECFNAQTEQTANLILESHCRWVAMLTGFSVSIYQSTPLWHNVLMYQCPHQPTSSKHKVKCVFLLLCCVMLGWRDAAGRDVWLCVVDEAQLAINDLYSCLVSYVCSDQEDTWRMCKSEYNVNTYSHKTLSGIGAVCRWFKL